MASTCSEFVWLIGLFEELGVDIKKPIELYCDSQAVLQIAANPVYHKMTKHIEIDCHFIRKKNQQRLIKTQHVSSKEQQADILTNALVRTQHEYLISKLGVLNIFAPLPV